MTYRTRKCLIIEDDEADRLMFKRVFSRLHSGYIADYAESLAAARRYLMDQTYTLIITDNSLRDGNAADFVMELSASKRLARIPILIVSDWPTPFMRAKAGTANVLAVMSKGQFDSEVLGRYLRRVTSRD